MKFRTQIMISFASILVAMLAVTVVVFFSVGNLIDASGWVAHTYEVIAKAEHMMASLVDQETGVRGYLATGDEVYLEPYTSGRMEFDQTALDLKTTVSDNPPQVARLESIEADARALEAEFNQPAMAIRAEINAGAALAAYFEEVRARIVGKQAFDALRVLIADVDGRFQRAGSLRGQYLITNILLAMVNQETGQRGYLLTGLEESLEPYVFGQAEFDRNIDALRQYAAANPGYGVAEAQIQGIVSQAAEWRRVAADVEIQARRDMNTVTTTPADLQAFMGQGIGKGYMDGIREKVAEFTAIEESLLVVRNSEAQATASRTTAVTLGGMGIALLIGVGAMILITRRVAAQLGGEPAYIQELAAKVALGDLKLELNGDGKKTVGVMGSMVEMVSALRAKAAAVEQIAAKDFTGSIAPASDADGLGHNLVVMRDALDDVLGQVAVAVDQVAAGSFQVTEASQDMSQGATEQASTLEEISSSVNQINGQARQNADNASEATSIARQAADAARSGNGQMASLRDAMEAISTSSDEIKKVVKLIDDIAFQINLLALNANVEAARAGKYGKGFAVVAEEVRNLAARSADAVRETTAMVDESVKNIAVGNDLTSETAKQLESIVSGAERAATFLEEIATASQEQAQGIDQITEGLGQVDQVTQANTATAEETAAAAEELSSQAEQLRHRVSDFTLRNRQGLENTGQRSIPAPEQATVEEPRETVSAGASNENGSSASVKIDLDDDDMSRF